MGLFEIEPIKWQKNEFGYFSENTIIKYKVYTNLHLPPHNQEKPYAVFYDGKPQYRADTINEAFSWVKANYLEFLAKHGVKPYEKKTTEQN